MPELRVPPASPPVLAPAATDPDPVPAWEAALERLLLAPRRVRVHYAPIVDLQRGVVRGYEAAAQIPEAPEVPSAEVLAAAARHGGAGVLEAQVLTAALTLRPLLVRHRVLSLTMGAAALGSAEVGRVLAGCGSLGGIVVDVTPAGGDDAIAGLQARGAAVAVAVKDAGDPGREHIAALAPAFLKLDAALVRRIADEPARAGEVRDLLELARRLDAPVIAEGVETDEQLDALARLGVTLGRGAALGAPAPTTGELDRGLGRRLRRRTLAGVREEGIGRLVEHVPAVGRDAAAAREAFARDPRLEHVVVVDEDARPVGILDRIAAGRGESPRSPLALLAVTAVEDVVRRTAGRPLEERWDPVVCVDAVGTYEGVVTLERLLATLAAS